MDIVINFLFLFSGILLGFLSYTPIENFVNNRYKKKEEEIKTGIYTITNGVISKVNIKR